MTRLGIATFSETPTATIVETPRLRRIGSRSVRDVQSLAPPLGRAREQSRVVVGTEPVGAALHQAVHDPHARRAGRRQQPDDVRQGLATGLGGQHRQTGVGTHHRALALLRDHCGMRGCHQVCEVGLHKGMTASAGMSMGGLVGEMS
jgi:hypothetical protein